ncbi:MAG: NADP-dependent oxidoreductase [Pseudomonadota bacterium]
MSDAKNRQVLLKARPESIPQAEHFEVTESAVPEPGEGQFLLRNAFLSVDPAMRGWVSAVANYSEPVALGAVMRAITVGQVVASRHPDYREGEWVCGLFGWQDYALSDGSNVWFKHHYDDLPVSTSLGLLGINGITAYFGLLDAGRPKAGDTVVVSTAAGAVGSAVGQIARIKGCRTVGITSTPEKMALCREVYGFDAALSYREGDLDAALAAACPDGVNVYYDNTAGAISDAVYRQLALGARCVICGTASLSSWDPWPEGPRIERHLLVKRASIQGILLFDFAERFAEARAALAGWLREGKLAYREEVLDGIEEAPGSIARLYASENVGKLLIRL